METGTIATRSFFINDLETYCLYTDQIDELSIKHGCKVLDRKYVHEKSICTITVEILRKNFSIIDTMNFMYSKGIVLTPIDDLKILEDPSLKWVDCCCEILKKIEEHESKETVCV